MNNELIVANNPKSGVAEAIKTIRTNLLFSSVDEPVKSILMTSSMSGEGKSFVSANLAIAFAQTGVKVLIVDCDLRRGRQHKIFNIDNEVKPLESSREEDNSKKEETSNNTDDLNTFDFSSMYGFDSKDEEHEDKQKVVAVTDFSDSVVSAEDKGEPKEDVKESSSLEDKSSDDNDDASLDELNDLFNYLNSDNSFNE